MSRSSAAPVEAHLRDVLTVVNWTKLRLEVKNYRCNFCRIADDFKISQELRIKPLPLSVTDLAP